MYVCVCKAVTESQITHAIKQRGCSRRQLMQRTGAGSVCGKCSLHIKAILDENAKCEGAKHAA